ncbi:MAG: hypothetical protein VZS44_01430 [Bacilli bacterium]|nr:hypothetical protein [Bacilli bacterium]
MPKSCKPLRRSHHYDSKLGQLIRDAINELTRNVSFFCCLRKKVRMIISFIKLWYDKDFDI